VVSPRRNRRPAPAPTREVTQQEAASLVEEDQQGNIAFIHEALIAKARQQEFEREELEEREAEQARRKTRASRSTSGASKESSTKKTKSDDNATTLTSYFREMAALDVLKPEEEFKAARDIEAIEILVWEESLSYAPAVDFTLRSVEASMDNSLPEFRKLRRTARDVLAGDAKAREASQQKLAKLARSTAEKLRALDVDKVYLDAFTLELGKLARGALVRATEDGVEVDSAHFKRYLHRVRGASRAAENARNDFVKANLRLVVSIARRFNHGRMSLADLIQEGNIGLMKAVERYDYSKGFRFSTYASWWIRHAISRALADKGREVRLPVHMIDAYHKISKATRELTSKLGRNPTTDEIAEATKIPGPKIEKMRTYLVDQSFSLDRPVNEEDGRSFVEFLQDPNADEKNPVDELVSQTMNDSVRSLLSQLKPIEADILRKRFGLGDDNELTLKEIGEEYNLSRERIRQLQEQALVKMRRAMQRLDLM